MKKIASLVLLVLLGSLYNAYSQPYRWIVPGTMSHRLDGSLNPVIDNNYLHRGHYYGFDVGGGQTNWGNSSQYKEFALFEHVNNPNWITQPSDVDSLEEKDWKRHMLNFRMAYPLVFDSANIAPGEKYPLLLMMHGAGERADCWRGNCHSDSNPKLYLNNDHNVSHGGRIQIDAINRDPSNPRHWPGFVVVPQNKSGWNPGSYVPRVIDLIEELMEYYPIDPDRIYVHGLSNGADGTWMLVNERPDLFAAIAAMSGFANNGGFSYDVVGMDTTMVHVPVWQFQGGRDNNPRQSSTEQKMQQLRNVGGTPRYTLYPNLGHGTWNAAWNEPDFFPWLLQYTKLSIHSFYGVSEVCEGDEVAVRLGISPGFDDYEWEKTNLNGIVSTMTGVSGWPNEIIADEIGSYRVRFARGTEWTEWSEPFVITGKQRPTAEIDANASVALPGLDNRIDITLSTSDQSGLYYEWYKDDVLFAEDSSLYSLVVTDPGEYQLVVKDQGLCKSFPSNSQFVSTLPYTGTLPESPTNLSAVGFSAGSIALYWTDNAQNEIGYDIYRSKTTNNFTWVGKTGPNTISFVDSNLEGDTEYFYKIRSYNENGASDPTETVSGITLPDTETPTAPGAMKVVGFNYTENRYNVRGENYADENFLVHLDELILTWLPSSDNVGISEYEVYTSNGTLIGTTADTTYIASGLNLDQTYSFYVVAKDISGNPSNPSNQESFTTTLNGVKFNLYAGGTWDLIEEFSDWSVLGSGVHNNFLTNAINGLYSDGDPDPNYFALEFFGYIYIEQAGSYTFATTSDDGSELWIGDNGISSRIVSNDGLHGAVKVTSSPIFLTAGPHPIAVKYFERTGGQYLNVTYSGPDTGNNEITIPDAALRSSNFTTLSGPVGPTGLSATAHASEFRIDLSWAHSDAGNVKFEIYRKLSENTNFEIVHTTSFGATSFSDTGLRASQEYDYKIRAINVNGSSEFSNVVTDTTEDDNEPPSIPANLTVQSVSESSVALSWDSSTDNVGVYEYIVYEGEEEVGTTSGRKNARKATSFARTSVTTTGLTIVIGGLNSGTEYTFTVAARDEALNTSLESNSVMATTSDAGPLPLDFINFYAENESNRVILRWTTASEINNERFEIERAFDPTQFEKIGALDGSGTTTDIKQYSFQDFNPSSVSYYRIKQVDFDGQFSYSKVIRVVFNADNLENLRVFPNPTDAGNINIKGFVPTENSAVSVQLIDVMGKVHFESVMDPNLILNGVEITTNRLLPSGIYVISISDGLNERIQRKLSIR